MAELSHEGREGHVDESITINLDPISDPMVIETVKNFQDLFIVADIFIIEKILSCFFEIVHNFDGDITSGDGRTFQSLLDQGSERGQHLDLLKMWQAFWKGQEARQRMRKNWKGGICLLGLVQMLLEWQNSGQVNMGGVLMYTPVFVVILRMGILEVWGLESLAFAVCSTRYRGGVLGQGGQHGKKMTICALINP